MKRSPRSTCLIVSASEAREPSRIGKSGTFPAPLKEPGSTFNFWMESEVDDYLKKFAAQRKAHVEQSQTDGAQATVAA